jgi:hypothetical protein
MCFENYSKCTSFIGIITYGSPNLGNTYKQIFYRDNVIYISHKRVLILILS